MARFALSERALADLASIAEYTREHWGAARAAAWLDALEGRLTELAERPRLGRRRDELADGLLSFPFESHVVFYTPADFGIAIVRILHHRQDPHRHIG